MKNTLQATNGFYTDDVLEISMAKGQLISKGLFDVIVSTKKPTIFFKDFCPSLQKEVGSKK